MDDPRSVGPGDYTWVPDPERSLKYAVQCVDGDRAELVEGVIVLRGSSWAKTSLVARIREQLVPRMEALGLVSGSGFLDMPGTLNFLVPDLAVVPVELGRTRGALVPCNTLLVVEVSDVPDPDPVMRKDRYAEFAAPLYLLVHRVSRSWTLFSVPQEGEYTVVDGPHRCGGLVRLPAPFDIDLDTSEFWPSNY